MKITFLGHSTILAHIGGKNILFDPFITPNELANQIDVNELKVDYILVSHGHEDHVADVESIAKRTGAIIVSNFEITTWFEKRGCQNVHPMNIGGQWQFDFGNVRYVNAIHSSTMPDGASGGMPGGFVISSEDGNFYFAGDTALTYDMKLIPRYAKIDFAVLPIGDNFTMGFEDAVVAAQWVNTAKVLAVHFDTFGFIKVDHEAVKTVFNKEQIELILPEIGSTYNL
ncbi:MAG: L-ascorbate metabolism protein UlaG (beta-lactamase superfamily) [Saprospiraceae bacterium]|jgi:L-ascorbate metabolism protein UlaG (beta-lactamase superfamily)